MLVADFRVAVGPRAAAQVAHIACPSLPCPILPLYRECRGEDAISEQKNNRDSLHIRE